MGSSILITGVNGFVGGSLANYFVSKGHRVTGIGRQAALAKFVHPSCDYIQADVTSKLQPFNVDIVIHSAGCADDRAKADVHYRNNVAGTISVLQASMRVKKFIYVSTSSVYAFEDHPVCEKEAGKNFNELSPYGKSKYLAEQEVLNEKHIPCKYILRPRAIYGINDRLILPRLLRLIKGDYLLLPETITKQISLTHIDNFISAVDLCINNTTYKSVFNVSDDQVYALDGAIRLLTEASVERPLKIKRIPGALWESLVLANEYLQFNKNLSRFGADQLTKTAVLNIENIKEELNYRPDKNMDSEHEKIGQWIKRSGGWKSYLQSHTN